MAVPAAAGSIVVFSSLTPHMTGPNTTDDVRKTYILQYAPDGAERLDGDPPGRLHVRYEGGLGGDTPPERVDAHAMMRSAIMLCEVIIEQHNVRVVESFAATRSEVLAVDSQLVQIFVNLLSNAASAMPDDGGVIELMTSVRGDNIVCAVIDNGAGIDEATAAHIFEPFFTTRKTTGGSGLGLPLVRALVERHGGNVEFESVLGEGTTFRIVLPLLPSA